MSDAVEHPGSYIKEHVIPNGVSVKKAAELMDVGRPALSNLLNGNAALSSDMAVRLEKAFGAKREDLLQRQAAFDDAQARERQKEVAVRSYVPPFLAIKANDIEAWVVHNIPARVRLAVFLRTLVNSTGLGLTKAEFHGNDDAERPGWDGFVEANEGTPWIPAGQSGWELGVNVNIKEKADGDFAKSVKAHTKEEREQITFVFVTPRVWPGKDDWEKAAKASRKWKDVRVYDASNLEQWLEQSLAGQAWFASETKIPAQDVRSLDKCWSDWADVSNPPLTGTLFEPAIDAARRTVESRLAKAPDGPIVVTADSVEEALAFLSQLLGDRGGDLAVHRDRTLVFDKPGILPRLAEGAKTFIPIVHKREVERELAPFAKSMHCFVVYPRNGANADPNIVLEPVGYEPFRKALEEMGKDRDEISRLGDSSGRSLTVLRRRLSTVPAVQTPEWAERHDVASSLVPFLFVGAWSRTNETDRECLSLIAGKPYEELEKECQQLVQLNDAPMWSIGTFRGVVSKIDLLHAIAGSITDRDLKNYFSMARMVLGEDDPALDLADDERWAAAIHGKVRQTSGAFREGIAETLVLLAVHGNKLFKTRLGIDTEHEAAAVVRDLLPTPLATRKLEANDRDLPTYAEAVPETFLTILETDLATDPPAVLGLLRPASSSGIFGGGISRTGLLWALEGLAWNPATMLRTVLILARLAQVEITDNWANKPIKSLESIFRAWMPQTAASLEVRLDVMKKLAKDYPDIAWKICMAQFGVHSEIGDYSHKPKWRPDGYGFGEPFRTTGPASAFRREMVEMALNWKGHTLGMLHDLIERLNVLDKTYQAKVWDLVKDWAKTASDPDKSAMREKIRVGTLSTGAARRAKHHANAEHVAVAAKEVYALLEPTDLLNKHAWMFREYWVEESADEIHGEEFDYKKREERIKKLRIAALQEVFAARGFEGVIELAERGNAGGQIGALTINEVLPEADVLPFLRSVFEPIRTGSADAGARKNVIFGALHSRPNDEKRGELIADFIVALSDDEAAQFLQLAPFRRSTWVLVDKLSDAAQAKYWDEVGPDWIHDSDAENTEAVERLLKGKRPRAAFSCARFHPEKFDGRLLHRVLLEMVQPSNDKPGHYQADQWNIEQVFKAVDKSADLTLDQKAGLESAYLDVLARPWSSQEGYGIPNLELYVERNPEAFVEALVWAYKRKDGGIDPPEFQADPDKAGRLAQWGFKLLEALERIPGHDNDDILTAEQLATWLKTVRDSCADLSRADIGDVCIGKLLSSAPVGADGVWPCEPVRQVMEEIRSEPMMSGAHTGLYNSRGAHWRGEGGDQERELANKYRKWAEALQFTHPYVSSKLLMGMVRTYEDEADRHDTEAGLRRRLR